MINIKLENSVIEYSREYHFKNNLGKRGFFDGNSTQQFIGIVAENTIRKYYGFEFMKSTGNWDGGFDIFWNGYKTDIKSSSRNSYPKEHWHHVVFEPQIKHQAEAFIFSSINLKEKVLTITGWITKQELLKKCDLTNVGDKIYLDNGDFIIANKSSFDIKILDLKNPLLNFEINN